MLRVISLGAGVQSTTMALMAAHGEIEPMPDCAIFADTQWEPHAVYEHFEWLRSPNVLPFPIHVVSKGNIKEDLLARGPNARRFASIPYFTEGGGMVRRQCTKEYKLYPIRDESKRLLGWPKGKRIHKGSIEQWVGISMDEIFRMKPSTVGYITVRHPLIELGMTRGDCLEWLKRHDYPEPPKSACLGCPYHNDAMWRDIKRNDPEGWADIVATDKAMRSSPRRGMKQLEYMHHSCKPMDEIDFDNLEDKGQLNMFNDECEGMCGV